MLPIDALIWRSCGCSYHACAVCLLTEMNIVRNFVFFTEIRERFIFIYIWYQDLFKSAGSEGSTRATFDLYEQYYNRQYLIRNWKAAESSPKPVMSIVCYMLLF